MRCCVRARIPWEIDQVCPEVDHHRVRRYICGVRKMTVYLPDLLDSRLAAEAVATGSARLS